MYVAGHRGMVGSAIVRRLQQGGYANLLTRTRQELDLLDQRAVLDFLQQEKPDYIFLAAARVGGIHANNTFRADFIYENLAIQNHIIHGALAAGIKDLCFLGSSCIYPRDCQQPIREEIHRRGTQENLYFRRHWFGHFGLFDERSCHVTGRFWLVGFVSVDRRTTFGNGGRMMTFTEAAFYGMGLVLLFGIAALLLAYLSKPGERDDRPVMHG
ncbi:MAG: NAD-dependent epimerase/dehydratase family protein [Rhodocyclaceae bacterium]|nr:NAD-dependent epimerase/dehydratase family protein [Rhodocyclaceae bacterium]